MATFQWPSAPPATNPSVGPNGSPIPTSSTLVAGEGPTGLETPISVDASGSVNVVIASGIANPLPVTDAAAEASLASIDTKLTAPLSVTGPLTDAQLRASAVPVSLASSPLPAGAATEATLLAFSAKTAGAFVPAAFDYAAITYVGVTTDIDTVTYKTGGSGGTTVAVLTMGYDGSSRLTSVTKT